MNPKTMQQLFRINTGGSFPFFLEVTHSSLPGGIIRLVSATQDMVFEGHTFIKANFKMKPPKYADGKYGNATLSITSLDPEVIKTIRLLPTKATARVVAAFYYEAGDLSIEPIDDLSFLLTNVTWDGLIASWQMVLDDRMSLLCPADTMSALNCPGAS